MRLDTVTVELRPRSPWEAVELGTALVREHARAIWTPWLAVTLPVFVLLNVIGWVTDLLMWAPVVFWWLKPVFDRVPSFVLSRAVFGSAPTTRVTLAAQRTWGWHAMLHALTWRRLDPCRSLNLPIALLEGGGNAARRRVIGAAGRGVASMVTWVFFHFEIVLVLAVPALVPLFAPEHYVGESASGVLDLLTQDPARWVLLTANAIYYVAMTAMEPFYVGAGFGLYLNRRTQLEAWDVELAFRRLRERLANALGGTTLALLLAIGGALVPDGVAWATPATPAVPQAKEAAPKPEPPGPPTFPTVFGDEYVPPGQFERAVGKLKDDPLLHPKDTETVWVPREKSKKKAPAQLPAWIGAAFGIIFESGLWIALGIVVLLLILTSKQWRPWLRDALAIPRAEPSPVEVAPVDAHDALPMDLVGAVRLFWQEGQRRRALALLYRASVEGMVARTGALLVPGATEAECLRASRALRDAEDRDAFASIVRTWQYAAYADRMPDGDAFEALLSRLSQRFGWAT